ncbi:hypothetical protein DFH27DRAFT_84303 [Peziza echinospora]|nr:hypothetical protein DFH27DRAFT_84303 [Peziza echinospora]
MPASTNLPSNTIRKWLNETPTRGVVPPNPGPVIPETASNPYTCNIDNCRKTFRDTWHLSDHQRTHEGHSTPIPCGYCGRKIGRPRDMTRHLNKCPKRPMTFPSDPVSSPGRSPQISTNSKSIQSSSTPSWISDPDGKFQRAIFSSSGQPSGSNCDTNSSPMISVPESVGSAGPSDAKQQRLTPPTLAKDISNKSVLFGIQGTETADVCSMDNLLHVPRSPLGPEGNTQNPTLPAAGTILQLREFAQAAENFSGTGEEEMEDLHLGYNSDAAGNQELLGHQPDIRDMPDIDIDSFFPSNDNLLQFMGSNHN